MYNINNHYNFILQYVSTKIRASKLAYFFPFGSTLYENIEFIGSNEPDILLLCYDQEPLNFNYNLPTIEEFDRQTFFNYSYDKNKDRKYYSKHLNSYITLQAEYVLRNKKATTILLNTDKDCDQKDKILKKFNYIDCYYFFHALAAIDWFRGYQFCHEIIPIKKRSITKKFITFNRIIGNLRIYRALFIALLSKKNLLELGHISFSKNCPVHGNLQSSVLNVIKEFNLEKNFVFDNLQHVSTLPDLRIDSEIDSPIENSSFIIGAISKSMESFVHIVTETYFWDRRKHLTEKIFKPIVLKQPFILLGCPNNLSYLKEYGFKTFDRWWDESYDLCEDPIQRIQMVSNLIESICKLSNKQLQTMLHEMEEILEYNHALFYSQDFVNTIWKELTVNLDAAIVQASRPTVLKTLDQNHLYISENKSLV